MPEVLQISEGSSLKKLGFHERKLSEIPTSEIFEHILDSDSREIEKEIILTIIALIRNYFIETIGPMYSSFLSSTRTDLMGNLIWCWKTKEGVLAKRIGKWYYDTHKENLSQEILSKIGTIARTSIPPEYTYAMDISSSVDWEQGQFGDIKSCFFNTSTPSSGLTALEKVSYNPRAKVLRFFKRNEKVYGSVPKSAKNLTIHETETHYYTGSSRAWIYEVEKDRQVIFNGYGITLDKMAMIYSEAVGKDYQKVDLSSNDFFVNNGSGYIIYPKGKSFSKTYSILLTPNDSSKVEMKLRGGIPLRGRENHPPPIAQLMPDELMVN